MPCKLVDQQIKHKESVEHFDPSSLQLKPGHQGGFAIKTFKSEKITTSFQLLKIQAIFPWLSEPNGTYSELLSF
jgi:hypothetical protein